MVCKWLPLQVPVKLLVINPVGVNWSSLTFVSFLQGWEYASVNGEEVPRPKAGACGGVWGTNIHKAICAVSICT
jgi:hypothetical protein